MQKENFEDILSQILADKEPPADLLSRISLAIERRRCFYARVKAFSFSVVLVLSSALIFFMFGELARQLAQNGTLEIISLVFSDTLVILANWQAFALSILESLPVWPIVLVSAGALAALVSIKLILENLFKVNLRFNVQY
jgi:hypothetical protein